METAERAYDLNKVAQLRHGKMPELEERLKELSLAYHSESQPELKELQLLDGKKQLQGFAAIQAHLDELSKELHQWYYCNCWFSSYRQFQAGDN